MSHDATRRPLPRAPGDRVVPHPPRRVHQARPKRHAAAALPTTRNYPFDWAPSGLVQEQLGAGEVKRVDALAQMKQKFQAASYSDGVQVGPGARAAHAVRGRVSTLTDCHTYHSQPLRARDRRGGTLAMVCTDAAVPWRFHIDPFCGCTAPARSRPTSAALSKGPFPQHRPDAPHRTTRSCGGHCMVVRSIAIARC